MTLAIKALGDFTAKLPALAQPGCKLMLEGPYGSFDFASADNVDRSNDAVHQVWIAGGIGITPFLARLSELAGAHKNPTAKTDLFYCTPNSKKSDFPAQLEQLCQAAGVNLHRRLTDRDGPLNSKEVAACLQPSSSVWFCGPSAWGEALGKTLTASGLPATAYHQEAFEFR